MNTKRFNISAVERDTGLSKDLLRMWERRYGFPVPERDANGERLYPIDQIERLRLIKRLIDRGFRPGKLHASSEADMQELLSTGQPTQDTDHQIDYSHYLSMLSNGDLNGLRSHLQQCIGRQGIHDFVLDTASPLTTAVGEAWMQGQLRIHEEHAYTETLNSLLRQAIASLPAGNTPKLLLTTVPDEEHSLGLLMAEVLFRLEGAECISLGARTPLLDIAEAAKAHKVDAVALSFSSLFPPRQALIQLTELRGYLPAHTELWIGGGGAERIIPISGVSVGSGKQGPSKLLEQWRTANATTPLAGS